MNRLTIICVLILSFNGFSNSLLSDYIECLCKIHDNGVSFTALSKIDTTKGMEIWSGRMIGAITSLKSDYSEMKNLMQSHFNSKDSIESNASLICASKLGTLMLYTDSLITDFEKQMNGEIKIGTFISHFYQSIALSQKELDKYYEVGIYYAAYLKSIKANIPDKEDLISNLDSSFGKSIQNVTKPENLPTQVFAAAGLRMFLINYKK